MSGLHQLFFSRYLREGDEMRAIFHRHFLAVFPNIFFWLLVPVGAVSWGVHKWLYPGILETPFLWLFEGYIFLMFIIILYKVIDWYADAWILTERGIIDVRWSLFMLDMSFTEYHDISAIQYSQETLFDKMFHIGDITLHKMGDEIRIAYMYQPDRIVAAIQQELHTEHEYHDEKTGPEMHIYVDGFRQNHEMMRYKDGYRYMPRAGNEEDEFVEKIRHQKGTIDLSGNTHETSREHDAH